MEINIAPKNAKQHNCSCFVVTFSFKNIHANIIINIGEVTIKDNASPKGSSITPLNQKILQIVPINPLK